MSGFCLRLIAATALLFILVAGRAQAEDAPAGWAERIMPPFSLGEPVNEQGVWSLLNSGGAPAGFVFETEPLAPLPGFSGAPINMLVVVDGDGRFMDVRLLSHNEPIFVSGLGEAPFHKFFEQYRGHSISTPMVVGTPYGDGGGGGGLVYLDGVTKATASVRIAHESILAATLAVAREKMRGVSTTPPARPDPDHDEPLSWSDLVEQGLIVRKLVLNREVDAAFADTLWADDDLEAREEPEGVYLDLWLVDLGPKAVARAAVSRDTFEALRQFQAISPEDEPLLAIDAGRHGLVSPDFVRNTAPDWLGAEQDGLPIALRDADIDVELHPDAPDALQDGVAMILRADRRLGFDPTRPWTLSVSAVRAHGMFQPELGSQDLSVDYVADDRFFVRPQTPVALPPWLEAVMARPIDMAALSLGLAALIGLFAFKLETVASARRFQTARIAFLIGMIAFVGYWGQGQLSIVTISAAIRAMIDGGGFAFLIYDPFSMAIWAAALIGAALWGRGLYCGWLCPFGAMQELAHRLGRLLRAPQIDPSPVWDARLRKLKYLLLGGFLATIFFAPDQVEVVAEIEPFKTAVTTSFARAWHFALYAIAWLVLSVFLFKGFCRYVCPLGAAMAVLGRLRRWDWITRRADCGSPCQLCKVRCGYGAIAPSGAVRYDECFQCLDCVSIHENPKQCVPLVIAGRRRGPAPDLTAAE